MDLYRALIKAKARCWLSVFSIGDWIVTKASSAGCNSPLWSFWSWGGSVCSETAFMPR